MLKLRRGVVVSANPLETEIEGERRRAWADEAMVGICEVGDEVIVNVEALDLNLGSGGFDIVHVNLSRGLEAQGSADEHVMKLNYTSLQHPVGTIERTPEQVEQSQGDPPPPLLAIGLHGHLAPAAWAIAERAQQEGKEPPRVGYVQTGGGALPGSFSRDLMQLRDLGLIAGHITAGPSYGGEHEAITLVGAIDAARSLGWQAVICGPGPGILGSATVYGNGGMSVVESAHAGLALGSDVVVSLRLSDSDPRPRHRGLSHHSRSALKLLLEPVHAALPAGQEELAGLIEGRNGIKHSISIEEFDLTGYGGSGLPHRTMGRDIDEDPTFFAGPLAAGSRLARLIT